MGFHPPLLLQTVAGLQDFLDLARSQPQRVDSETIPVSVGFVPTMGALHAGHLSLIQRARQENQVVIVSIFVNPLQFGPSEDLANYPRDLEQDYRLCQEAGVDAVFAPTVATLFAAGPPATQVVPPVGMIAELCGRSRPGHFQGVLTIVAKFLHLVQPQRVYFGQKDAQQLALIRQMVTDLSFPVEVIACPIVREPSGLACSSRNQYLTPAQRQQASILYRGLQAAEQLFLTGVRESESLKQIVEETLAQYPEVQPEYVELVDPITLAHLAAVEPQGLLAIAVRLGRTRLIDNLLLDARQPILAIDGPAGVGKSTVTRQCAQILGLLHLDTGAMYRAATWLVLQANLECQDRVAVAELIGQAQIQLISDANTPNGLRVQVNGQDVTEAIRGLEVTAHVSQIAAQPAVRQLLVQQQRRYGYKGGIAAEGRDIGTHVFPEAQLKIFLTASIQERARRRYRELQQQGITSLSLEQLEQDIQNRDYKDSHRAYAPLRRAIDAIEVNTDHLSVAEVIQRIVDLYRSRFPHCPPVV